MTVQHKDLIDPEIHEPKGISMAAVKTVYVADGNGGGNWTYPELEGTDDAVNNSVPVKRGGDVIWTPISSTDPAYINAESNTSSSVSGTFTYSSPSLTTGKFSVSGGIINIIESGFYLFLIYGHASSNPGTGGGGDPTNSSRTITADINGLSVPVVSVGGSSPDMKSGTLPYVIELPESATFSVSWSGANGQGGGSGQVSCRFSIVRVG